MKGRNSKTRSKPGEADEGPSDKNQSQERIQSPPQITPKRRSTRHDVVDQIKDRPEDDPHKNEKAELEKQCKIHKKTMEAMDELSSKLEEAYDSLSRLEGGVEVARKRSELKLSLKADREDGVPESKLSEKSKKIMDAFEKAQADAYTDLQAHAMVVSAIELKIKNLREEAIEVEDTIVGLENAINELPPFH